MRRRGVKSALKGRVRPEELRLLYRSYDIVGDIAIIRVPAGLEHLSRPVAEAIMSIHRNVRVVLRQVGPVRGDWRLRELEWVAGERRTETIHREHGCLFKVDLQKCYFSPRLSYERLRIARQVQPGEIIVNMFAGVGCYSIIIAKHSQAEKVYSIDINPAAVAYLRENVRLNRLEGRVVPIEGDAGRVIEDRLRFVADRVLMPLPEKAWEFMDYALLALKPEGGWIHYYEFVHARRGEDPVEKVKVKLSEGLGKTCTSLKISFGRVVRTTGPNWYQVAVDFWARK